MESFDCLPCKFKCHAYMGHVFHLLQAISMMMYAQKHLGMKGPILVLGPLTVLETWKYHLKA